MRTPICDDLGIEFPIFAFTHCRDVVVAVSKAGGFGVLGAVGFSPEQLEIEMTWIDEHIGDAPYGVDIVIPNKYEGMDADMSTDDLTKMLQDMVPQKHLDFARNLLVDHGVPLQEGDDNSLKLLGWTEATATPQVELALQHPKVKLIANALGTPPKDMIDHIHAEGRKVAALCGSPYQARKHADADVDIIIAQGGEGGGHCGEVGSIVLWPQVVKEVAPRPVLAAGGIGSGQQIAAALALGCQGAWSGSQWLMVEEAENTPVQQQAYIDAGSRDTVRSRSFTGKPCRMLKNDWTDAWEDPENPDPLGMPLQYMVSGMAVAATHRWPDQTVDVAFNPVGQVVGQFEKVEKSAAVIERWVNEYLEATSHLDELNGGRGGLTMAVFQPYLFFGGNCREAFTRYHEIFGGEVFVMTMAEAPDAGDVPPEQADMVIHAALTFEDGGLLMASDGPMNDDFGPVQGMMVSYAATDADDARRVFDALADGGTVNQDLIATFFSSGFGMCTDRFGTPWMVVAPEATGAA